MREIEIRKVTLLASRACAWRVRARVLWSYRSRLPLLIRVQGFALLSALVVALADSDSSRAHADDTVFCPHEQRLRSTEGVSCRRWAVDD